MKNLTLLLASVAWSAVTVTATESPYLKEVLMGRCYFAPPVTTTKGGAKGEDTCPALVGSIMNVLESQLDGNIGASAFDSYLEQADFSSPPDKSLFYLRFFGESAKTFSPPRGLVSPEDTPGGALFKDLVFCGVDQRGNCSIEKSNAYWTFWEAGTYAYDSTPDDDAA